LDGTASEGLWVLNESEWVENENDLGIAEQQEVFGGLHGIVATSSY
jgi:hypothetical protein